MRNNYFKDEDENTYNGYEIRPGESIEDYNDRIESYNDTLDGLND